MSKGERVFTEKIQREFAGMRCTLMEVCGTHTNAIRKAGIHRMVPPGIRLLSGPGCPVCVTGGGYIEQAVRLSKDSRNVIATFGDLMKVPGNTQTLAAARADGANLRIVYSPLDAVDFAAASPGKNIVFLGVGFETTAPVIALAVCEAQRRGIRNFFVLPAIKILKPALEALLSDPDIKVDGLIAPGHLSVITGAGAFAYIPERFKLPTVITGFRMEEIWMGLVALLNQIKTGAAMLENKYPGVVTYEGNRAAQAAIGEVFVPEDAEWRGLGVIPGSGLGLNAKYREFDAREHFNLLPIKSVEPPGCLCGSILLGKSLPEECPHFGRGCTPESPVGPCMVSSEGSCAAHFYYRERE